jgi:TrmH family RNA methyltransferase
MAAANQGVEVLQVSGELFRDLSDTEHGQGIIAVCSLPENELGNVITGKTVLMLDGVSDPGNVGTAIRSASAFGCGGVVCGKGTCFPFLPRVSRSAAGWNASIPIVHGIRLEGAAQTLKDSGYRILGSDSDGQSIHDLPLQSTPVALVIGSETRGISPLVREVLEGVVSIPMEEGVESLNAGVSASILLYCLIRNQNL